MVHMTGAYQVDSGLVTAMIPVGFVMIVSLMVWLVRTINQLATTIATLDATTAARITAVTVSVEGVAEKVKDIKEDRARLLPEWDKHVASDATVAEDVAWIKGKLLPGERR